MRTALLVVFALLWAAPSRADEGSSEGSAEHHEDPSGSGAAAPEPEHHEDSSGSGAAAPVVEHHEDGSGSAEPVAAHHEETAGPDTAVAEDADGEPVTDPFDEDGDGKLEPEEIADKEGFKAAFAGIPEEPDEAALEARPADKDLVPSLSKEKFRELVRWTKRVVLEKMEAKMARKAAKKMKTFALMVFGVSLLGLLILLVPLGMMKKYPGKGGLLFKYAALAAGTFFVTVNLFGGVLFGLRTVQTALAHYTNPAIAIASGTFDTLDENVDDYIVMGKELFAPTLEQLKSHPDEQPAVVILENGMRIVKDAQVFVSIAKMFKKVSFVFDFLPIILFLVTLFLFGRAIYPTMKEIILLPAKAAAGEATGGEVIKRAMRRVWGELLATLATIGVLAALSLLSGFVLSQIVQPAIAALLEYFALSLNYLQFVKGASSGFVFLALFGVILFLVLNLATLILSMAFFLGKWQKIFQARFNAGVPLARHKRFFTWGVPSVIWVQVFPWLFVLGSSVALNRLNASLIGSTVDADGISWRELLVAGPLFLVVAFMVLFWAVRGLKAIRFLQSYKVT